MSSPSSSNPELRGALERLYALQTFGIKLGLDPTLRLLAEFDNPHLRFPSIHIAGTNGKGSVCALVASVLSAAGFRVGLYTSPHLVNFSERMRINGVPIPDERLASYAREMLPTIEHVGGTFFEGTTAIAFRYFAEEEIDVAVVETGMGGRLDSTNVITPLVSAITSISMDHMKHLGETIELIAGEKAGIMKAGVPAVIGHVTPGLREIFSQHALKVGAPVHFVDDEVRSAFRGIEPGYTRASFRFVGDSGERIIENLAIGFAGRHQIDNARVALAVLEQVRARFPFDDDSLRRGFAEARSRTGTRGRFEIAASRPRIILDVAHNADGARVLADTLRLLDGTRAARMVYGAVEDKDVVEILRVLGPLVAKLYAVRAESTRSLASWEIARAAASAGIASIDCGSVSDGLGRARADATADETILVCGSFYVVGEAIEELERGDSATAKPGVVSEPAAGYLESDTEIPMSPKRLTVKDWSESEKPRERLMEQGASSLSDAELIAILLRTGTREHDVVRLSRQLVDGYGSLAELAKRDWSELKSVAGIGPTKAVTLAAAFELARRSRADGYDKKKKISGPKDIADIYIPALRHVQKEQFHVVVLNTANQIVRRLMVSEGNLNSSIVHPREVFRLAIVESAAAVIGLHNHPSGNPAPSREDIAITRQLVEAGQIIGIPLHDHIIIAGEEYVSMAEKGYV